VRAALIGGSLGLAVPWALPAPAAHVPPLCDALGLERRAAVGADGVALTFDDGPHPRGTPAILDVLAAHGATATFFVVGEQVRRHPGIIEEVVAAGHRLAVHGDRHVCQLRRSPRALVADADRCAALVQDVQPGPVTHWRAPYGIFSAVALPLGRRRGWTPLLWSAWGRDWRARATPADVARRVAGAGPGDVVLLHDADTYSARDSWQVTAAALPRILDGFGGRGLRARAV
jgi:peptidoglycan/xylan/chitin deacetylase (PgdA/CDA1 family)